MSQSICSVRDCDRRVNAKALCLMHYKRWRKHGDPELGAAVQSPAVCAVADCGKSPQAKSLCPMHYQRQRLTGTTAYAPRPRKVRPKRNGVEPCEVDGCDRVIKGRGLCAAHWSRWKRHGSATARLRGQVVDGKRVCPHCLQDVPVRDWYVTPSGKFVLCGDCFGEDNRTRGHSRRAVISGSRFTRREILDRDNWVCQICDEPIREGLHWLEPMSATLDHIIPLARGGEHSRENSQAAHRICNLRKWAHMPIQ